MAELNPFASFAQGRQLGMQKRAEERLLEDRRRAETTRNRMAQLFAGGVPTTPEGRGAVVAEVAKTDPAAAVRWQERFDSMEPNLLARRKSEAPFVVAQLGNVADQAGYERAVSNLAGLGVDVSDFPPEYDPERIGTVTQAARYLAEGPAKAAGGPFSSKGLQADASNILLTADPSSPEYAMAKWILSQPRSFLDQGSGQVVSVTPDTAGLESALGRRPAVAAPAKETPPPMGPPGTGVKVTEGKPTMRPTNVPGTAGMSVTPIPGSKAARDAAKEAEKEEAAKASRQAKARIVLDDLDRVERIMEESIIPTTGFIGGIAKRFDETGAADINKILNSVRANIGFDQLNQMRAESKTGAALGNVTERETALLQSVLGSFDQELSEPEFRYALNRLRETFLDVIHGPGNRPDESEGVGESQETAAPSAQPTAAGLPRPKTKAERDALPPGTPYIAPDGTRAVRK